MENKTFNRFFEIWCENTSTLTHCYCMDNGLNVSVALLSPVCYRIIDRIDFDYVVVVVVFVVAYMIAFDGFDFVPEAVPMKSRIIVKNLVSGSCVYLTKNKLNTHRLGCWLIMALLILLRYNLLLYWHRLCWHLILLL